MITIADQALARLEELYELNELDELDEDYDAACWDFLSGLVLHDIHNKKNINETERLIFIDKSSIVWSDEKKAWEKDQGFDLKEFEKTLL